MLQISQEIITRDTLALTAKLLIWNPEYYTIWNHRKHVLQSLLSSSPSKSEDERHTHVQELLTADLQFLLPLLMKYPKCYWIWNYRVWLLHQSSSNLPLEITQVFWTKELGLVGKMLSRDSRNFHGWDYRRFVISELRKLAKTRTEKQPPKAELPTEEPASAPEVDANASLTESEFSYCTKMIQSNLSNFSAWHNRSTLIPRLLNERGADDESRRAFFDQELALIQNALFTDPYDQSLWFYHEFLMSELLPTNTKAFVRFNNQDRCEYLEKEIEAIKELLEDTDDCKMIYQHLLYYTEQYLDIEGGNSHITTSDMRFWLSELMKLDVLRKGRWDDLAKRLHLEE